jgi:hypothetical protein
MHVEQFVEKGGKSWLTHRNRKATVIIRRRKSFIEPRSNDNGRTTPSFPRKRCVPKKHRKAVSTVNGREYSLDEYVCTFSRYLQQAAEELRLAHSKEELGYNVTEWPRTLLVQLNEVRWHLNRISKHVPEFKDDIG